MIWDVILSMGPVVLIFVASMVLMAINACIIVKHEKTRALLVRIEVVLMIIMVGSGLALVILNTMDELKKERAHTGLPVGATIYEGDADDKAGWKKWKLGNDCYLSKDLDGRYGVLSKVTCP